MSSDQSIPPLYRDAQRYDAIAREVDDDLLWWCGQVGYAQSCVLDLGCGTGRVSLALAELGVQVWGLDNAPAMLDAARAKAQALGQQQRLHLQQGDMRDFRLAAAPPMDAVIIANNTIAHLLHEEDLRATLGCAATHLRPGGRLLIDTFAAGAQSQGSGSELLLCYRDPHSGQPVQLHEQHRYDHHSKCLQVLWHHRGPRQDQAAATGEALTLRVWSVAEITTALKACGFIPQAVYGDYDQQPFTPESPLQLIIAQRPPTAP